MIDVKLSTSNPSEYLMRQTPNRKGIWKDCRFHVNEEGVSCDYYVVYEGLTHSETVSCPRNKTMFITGEPPGYRKYEEKFLSQFHSILSVHRDLRHPRVINSQQGLPWLVGIDVDKSRGKIGSVLMDYDVLKERSFSKKDKFVSIIDSGKAYTYGHRLRRKFIRRLMKRSKFDIDIYSTSKDELRDKASAISDYRYHIGLENCIFPHYWTEKITDPFLTLTMPIYHGCPNILEYYPSESIKRIDIRRMDEAISSIDEFLTRDPYYDELEYIKKSKSLAIDDYNIFNVINEMVTNDVEKKDSPVKWEAKAEIGAWDKNSPIERRIHLSLTMGWNNALDRLDSAFYP